MKIQKKTRKKSEKNTAEIKKENIQNFKCFENLNITQLFLGVT